jgi:ribosome-binding factor A
MADAGRARRMSARIKQIVASMIDTQIKDPRLGMVTITDVRLTGDLHDATVFYTVLGDAEVREASARALASANGLIRSEVGRLIGVRYTPSLTFVLDELPETAHALEELLQRAALADAEVEKARAGAVHAGEVDAYRRPREADESE